MKKALFTLFLISVVSFTFAGNTENDANKAKSTEAPSSAPVASAAISGKVVDLNTGEALAGVEVSIEGSSRKVRTDLDGNFRIENLQAGEYNVIASYISYNKSLIEKFEVGKSTRDLKIKLQSAN